MANYLLFLGVSHNCHAACRNMALAVLESELPFAKGNGLPLFEWLAHAPHMSRQFQDAMTDDSNRILPQLLTKYNNFKDVKVLMDVGGGNGTILAKIVEHYPHIKGINFDLPEIVAQAPPRLGVEHVAGDMFKSIPSGCDAILMKARKVIMVDAVLPNSAHDEQSLDNLMGFMYDMTMLAMTSGLERDATQWQTLASKSGFGKLDSRNRVGGAVGHHKPKPRVCFEHPLK